MIYLIAARVVVATLVRVIGGDLYLLRKGGELSRRSNS